MDLSDQDSLRDGKEAERRELWCTMTSMYLFLEVARIKEKEDGNLSIREAICKNFDKYSIVGKKLTPML